MAAAERKRAPWRVPLTALEGLALTRDQAYIVKLVALRRANVLVAAEAGTGKSRVVAAVVAAGRAAGARVCVTGTTGVAATNLGEGAETLAAWMGMRVGVGRTPGAYVTHLHTRGAAAAVERLRAACVLIVDEVSMLTGEALDALDAGARFARGAALPFGGLQVVLLGDMLQLPVVQTEAGMAVGAEAFGRGGFVPATLRAVFRQGDADFQGLLRAVRRGRATPAHIAALQARVGPPPPGATVILPVNRAVREHNALKLDEAVRGGAPRVTACWGAGLVRVPLRGAGSGAVTLQCAPCPQGGEVAVTLVPTPKGGATVLPGGGTAGALCRRVQGLGGVVVPRSRAKAVQAVQWVLQGRRGGADTLDVAMAEGALVMVTANQRNSEGALVAANGFQGTLQGVRGKGLAITGVDGTEFVLPPRVTRVEAWRSSTYRVDAVVWWWDVALAHALTVHKTQGLTLARIAVDLGAEVFDPQQPYVALSRATSLEGVTVLPGFTGASLAPGKPTPGAAWTTAFEDTLERRAMAVARHKRPRH